jgi:hypothetical protein
VAVALHGLRRLTARPRWAGGQAPAPLRVRAAAGPARLEALDRRSPPGAAVAVAASGEAALWLGAAGRAVRLVEGAPGAAALYGLKHAALVALPPQSRAALFGLDGFGRRLWFYHFVRPGLEAADAAYWDAREEMLREGLGSAGVDERGWAGWRRARQGAAARLLRRLDAAAGGPAARAWALAPDSPAARWIWQGEGDFGLAALGSAGAPPPAQRLAGGSPAALIGAQSGLAAVDLADWPDRAPAQERAALWPALAAALAPGGAVALWSAAAPPACPPGFRCAAAGPDPDGPAPAGWAVLIRA